MVHLHYSPFQFSTAEQTQEPHKKVVAEKMESVRMYEKRKQETRDLHATMPVALAHSISSLPNAYISPNSIDVMRQSKSVFRF